MSNDNELTPEIEAALRDIPAADPALRDQHIATALDELAPAATMKRRNLFAAAAAVLVLAGAGFAVSQNSDGDTPAVATPDTTITSIPKASTECAGSKGFGGGIGGVESFSVGGTEFVVVRRGGAIEVLVGTQPCAQVGALEYLEALQSRNEQTDAPSEKQCTQKALVEFTDSAGGSEYRLALLETSDGVSLFFKDRCNEPLGSIALPTSGD